METVLSVERKHATTSCVSEYNSLLCCVRDTVDSWSAESLQISCWDCLSKSCNHPYVMIWMKKPSVIDQTHALTSHPNCSINWSFLPLVLNKGAECEHWCQLSCQPSGLRLQDLERLHSAQQAVWKQLATIGKCVRSTKAHTVISYMVHYLSKLKTRLYVISKNFIAKPVIIFFRSQILYSLQNLWYPNNKKIP